MILDICVGIWYNKHKCLYVCKTSGQMQAAPPVNKKYAVNDPYHIWA